MYLANKIDRRLAKLSQTWIGRQKISTIIEGLEKALKPYGVRISWVTNAKMKPNDYWIAAFFCEDRKNKPIELVFEFSSKRSDLNWNAIDIPHAMFCISQSLQHELIHKGQCAHRPLDVIAEGGWYQPVRHKKTGKSRDYLEYLSMFDEMDTYGHDIAMEIRYHYPDENPLDVLRTISTRRKIVSYGYYKKTFKGINWKPVHDRVLKKAFKWLPYTREYKNV